MDGMSQVGVQDCVDEVPILSSTDSWLVTGSFFESVVPVDDEIEQGVTHKRLEPACTDAGGTFRWTRLTSRLTYLIDFPEVIERNVEGDNLMRKEGVVVSG